MTGAELHLVEPLGFNFEDAHLRRAGLDYHDLAVVTVHKTLQDAWKALMPARVFAFTTTAATSYADLEYRDGDVLMFGPESVGLPADVQQDEHITERVKIPMIPGRRSLIWRTPRPSQFLKHGANTDSQEERFSFMCANRQVPLLLRT